MKIPIRTQAQLQRKIDRGVQSVELAGRLFFDWGKDTAPPPYRTVVKIREVYKIIAESAEPLDYRTITERLGLPLTVNCMFHVSSRLEHLAHRGYLKYAGRKYTAYYKDGIGAKLWVAVPPEQIPIIQRRIQKAINRLLRDIELTAYRVNDVTACLAQRIQQTNYQPKSYLWRDGDVATRNAEIIRLRLGGMALEQIGQKFGITRERARQVFEAAVSGVKKSSYLPRHKVDFDEANRTMRQIAMMGRYPKERKILLDVSDAILRMPQARQEKIQARATELIDEQLALDIIAAQLNKR